MGSAALNPAPGTVIATGPLGYQAPISTGGELNDRYLDRFLQTLLAGVSGLPGPLVRPRWQREPLNQPDIGVDWAAIGRIRKDSDAFPTVIQTVAVIPNPTPNNLQQTAADSFKRPNEDPLNPAVWAVQPLLAPMQLVDNQAAPTSAPEDSAANFVGSFSKNQYATIIVGNLVDENDTIAAAVCLQGETVGYFADVMGPLGPNAQIALVLSTISSEQTLGVYNGAINSGDQVDLLIFNGQLIVQLNGVAIITVVDVTLTSGNPGIAASTDGAVTDATIALAQGGNVIALGQSLPPGAADVTTTTSVSKTETLEIMASFYGPNAEYWSDRFIVGLGLDSNRYAMGLNGFALVALPQDALLATDLLKTRFVPRWDVTFRVRRYKEYQYESAFLIGADVEILTDVGLGPIDASVDPGYGQLPYGPGPYNNDLGGDS